MENALEAVGLAARLLTAGAFVFLSVGFAVLARLRMTSEWPERLLLALSISYSWIFGLSMLLPIIGWSVDYATVLTLVVVAAVTPWRALPGRIRSVRPPAGVTAFTNVCIGTAILAFAVGAWLIEPPIHGDAALDLISVSRFADGGSIGFDNTSVLPNTRATYIFQPYQLALGMIARTTQTDAIVAFQKIRPLLAVLTLAFVYAVLRQLLSAPAHALAAFAVVLVLVGLDVTTWESYSLLPVVHRGGFAAGICVPALMALILMATRREDDGSECSMARVAMYVAPVFLLASICTHALEIYTLLAFAGATGVVVLSGLDPSRDKRRLLALAGLVAAVLAIYLPIHTRALPELTRFEDDLKSQLTAEFSREYPDARTKLVGPMGQEAGDLLGGRIPATTAGVLGIAALASAVFLGPAAAASLALGTVPLAMMFASPAGFVALALATSADSVQEATAYFGLLGLLALSIGIAAIAHGLLIPASRLPSVVQRMLALAVLLGIGFALWSVEGTAAGYLLDFTRAQPRVFVLISALLMVAVLGVALWRKSHLVSLPRSQGAVVCLAVVLAIPLAGLGLPREERVSLVSGITRARQTPSVLDWNAYYGLLQNTILPRIPVPRPVVDALKRRVPPRQVLLADPRYSCSLAVLLDAYCINPEFIYGQYYLTARPYQERYVHSIEGVDADWHPFFNATWPMEDRERMFLQDYSVNYILADPEHTTLIARKLEALNIGATLEASTDGYAIYRLPSR